MRDAVVARGTLAAALALLLCAGIVVFVPGARANLSAPFLVAGSRWSYAYAAYDGGGTTTGSYVLQDVGTANIMEGGATYSCDRLAFFANLTMTSGTIQLRYNLSGDIFYRRSDLAIPQETVRTTVLGTLVTSTVSDAPPLSLEWPLVPGANWTSSTVRTTNSTSGGSSTTYTSNVTVDYTVGATEARTVPAGTFVTTPLNGTDSTGSYTLQYWSASVGFWAEEWIGTNTTLAILRLVSYRLMPANTPPAASFVWSPAIGDTTTIFAFTSTSTDAQNAASALQVRWDWDHDGTWDTVWSSNTTATHTFASPGVYNVTLEVMDTGGLTSNTTRQVSVTAASAPLGPAMFGVSVYVWLILAAAIAAVGIPLILVLRRRRARVPPQPPPPAP